MVIAWLGRWREEIGGDRPYQCRLRVALDSGAPALKGKHRMPLVIQAVVD